MNELELILTDIFRCSRTDLYLDSRTIIFRDREFSRLDKILKERGRTKPLQYILGYVEFMGLEFKINRDVLIPRPETEILVETIIEETKKLFSNANFRKSNANYREYISDHSRLISGNSRSRNIFHSSQLRILDIGTGSGCIAIALAEFLKNVDITATDISQKALELAKENARLHKIENIRFLQADLFNHKFFETDVKFDIIVSNPPYVKTQEIGYLDSSVTNEPREALDGGGDGLCFYRRIAKEAYRFLKDDGALFLELGYGQAENIRDIFSGCWNIERFTKDYQGIKRICIIRRSYG